MEIEDRRKAGLYCKIKNNPFLKKLKKVKNIEFIACVFILAIVLLLYSAVKSAQNASASVQTASSGNETDCSTDVEKRLESILSEIEGAGDVKVMITYCDEVQGGDSKRINGVIVVASGARDIGTRFELLRAVEAALNVDGNIVEIFMME